MLNELIDPYGYSLGEPFGRQCPVCGRIHTHILNGYWCPYCGTGLSPKLRDELRSLNDRIIILEKLLEWNKIPNEIGDLDELLNQEELNGESSNS